MLKDFFIRRPPAPFHINPVVKAFIISETIIWSSWNAIIPIFAIFIADKVPGGSIEVAASSFAVRLIAQVILELIIGRYLACSSERKKFIVSIIGIVFISFGYLGFAFTHSVFQIYLFNIVIGLGAGIANPAKNCLFSTHLDKNRETTEWSFYDATVLAGIAISATVGGFVATNYGFSLLFLIACVFNLFGIIPYVLLARKSVGDNGLKDLFFKKA